MNDFTKEELETLHSCLDQCKFDDGEDDELMAKLESMIDKLGGFAHEHQWIARNPTIQVEGYGGKTHDYSPVIIRCKTCGESYFS